MERQSSKPFDFWKDHSERFLKMAFATHRRETLDVSDGCGSSASACGDRVTFFLLVTDDVITHACFDARGCVNTIACANAVAEMAEGRSVNDAWGIDAGQVIAFLETLPEHEAHCAVMARDALRAALANFNTIRRQPWKKIYRR